ncbi:antitermination regulator [Mycobacterium intermedium]|uniref:histidine kinase n=1 Tax=Mycobacterium intermedium TaxID=28445 RepID=A0A1E3S6U4_MYCIE|nr:PAS and ANTAR domain-containing protein [Mycobacterium intermedium]MCV6966043.1 ANTAR domain-containing protein [Mycobacterium intermedium]ODQ97307.1 antitermination regulator [Mycobacterium intermedium]OPE47043.1 antitermination regulator [Mycobacterium intermedium]ORA96409.1 antitermination regulator [Mycobacterium intermedium]
MTWNLDGQAADVEQALAGGAPQRVGSFRFYFEDQRWEWSDQVQQMHGYEPGSVTPTTELVLSHKHPDDRGQVAATIDDILHNRKAFSTRHRIVDKAGKEHHVVVVGDRLCDDDGAVIGTHGFYVDVTPADHEMPDEVVTAKLAEIAENRAAIEQAKGMLMLVYDLDDAAAFNLLKWLSQDANVKLRRLAEQIRSEFRAAGPSLTSQAEFDQLLLAARDRARRSVGATKTR